MVSNSGGSSQYGKIAEFYVPNVASGHNANLHLGKSNTSKNTGKLIYRHVSDGSDDNFIGLSMHSQDNILVANGAGDVGIGTTNPTAKLSVDGSANKSGGGSWDTFSDRRIKKNIKNYTKGLAEIMQIRPVSYQYNKKSPFKNESGEPMVGVIAQEIQEVLPSTVTEKKTEHFEDLLSYDSSELLYTLINAVKELKAENDALRARVVKLEQQ